MRYGVIVGLVLCSMLVAACGGNEDADSKSRFDPDTPEGKGEQVFRANCATCHAIEGDRVIVGPSLNGIATRAGQRIEGLTAAEYIQQSILQPGAYVVEGFPDGAMPRNFARTLTTEQVDNLVAFLLKLE